MRRKNSNNILKISEPETESRIFLFELKYIKCEQNSTYMLKQELKVVLAVLTKIGKKN